VDLAPMTLANKLNWLIDRAWPDSAPERGCAEVAALVEQVTGKPVSHTTIWKLRNGKDANPQKRLIEMLALTFGVPAGFFFDDFGAGQAGLLQQRDAELLALVRRSDVSITQLRVILELSPEAIEAVTNLLAALKPKFPN
jgi:transcriptional regulator with XRE-family HTH domain